MIFICVTLVGLLVFSCTLLAHARRELRHFSAIADAEHAAARIIADAQRDAAQAHQHLRAARERIADAEYEAARIIALARSAMIDAE
ncbi:MAG TPA: hypothetical protein VK427_02395, partial [Kofleriaceae bacterium]|nr:hypothetical protein [Kofleriaceae bacterium]